MASTVGNICGMDDTAEAGERQNVRVGSGYLGAAMAAPQGGSTYDKEKQVSIDKGYSDLEVVESPGLEVAGSDASQTITPLYQPRFAEEQLPFSEHTLPEVNYQQHGSSYPPGVVPVRPPSGSTAHDYHYNGGANPFYPSEKSAGDRRICGLKRRIFWIVLAVVLLSIVAAIAIGVGAGLSVRSSHSASARYVRLTVFIC